MGIAADDAIGRPFRSLDIDWHDATNLFALIDNPPAVDQRRLEVAFSGADEAGRVLELLVCPVPHDQKKSGLLMLGTEARSSIL